MEQFVAFIIDHWVLSTLFAITLLLFVGHEIFLARGGQSDVSPQQAIQLINHQKALVIDVRQETLFSKNHILDALNVPLDQIDKVLEKKNHPLQKQVGKPIVLVCGNGQQSQQAASKLRQKGFQVSVLRGGLSSWTEAQLPVVRS